MSPARRPRFHNGQAWISVARRVGRRGRQTMIQSSERPGWLRLAAMTALVAVLLTACGRPPPPAGESRFTNARDNAKSGDLSAHYVDFTFDYPSSWVVEPAASGSPAYFVKIARKSADQKTDVETFAVGALPHDDQAAQAQL